MDKLVKFPPQMHKFARFVADNGARLHLVGGMVRDAVLGVESNDFDFVLVGLSMDDAVKMVARKHRVKTKVVSDAPVFKALVGDEWVDVAVARVEVLMDGVELDEVDWLSFTFHTGPEVTLQMDLMRRDTCHNAMAIDVLTGELFDPFDGQSRLKQGFLVPVGPHFVQSPERVFRAAADASRFGLKVSASLAEMATKMKPAVLKMMKEKPEQVWRHWKKLLLGKDPALGVMALVVMGLADTMPEFKAIMGVEQDKVWHPEGTVDVHSLMVLQVMTKFTEGMDDWHKLVLRMAALCHDFGKATTTVKGEDGRVRSPAHDTVGVPLASAFMKRVGFDMAFKNTHHVRAVEALVATHMRHPSTARGVRRLSVAVQPATLFDWALVCKADLGGRNAGEEELAERFARVDSVLALADTLGVCDDGPKPLVTGDHLIEMGMKQGKELGEMKAKAFEAQLDGEFDTVEGGLAFLFD